MGVGVRRGGRKRVGRKWENRRNTGRGEEGIGVVSGDKWASSGRGICHPDIGGTTDSRHRTSEGREKQACSRGFGKGKTSESLSDTG